MRAMVLKEVGQPLELQNLPIPQPHGFEVLIKVSACAICRTDLHIYDGELSSPKLPLILGHQIVGTIEKMGAQVTGRYKGERVGVPWLGSSDGSCFYCKTENENLCDNARFTGYQINGGYAEYCVADSRYIFTLPENYDDLSIAPLLCGGLIGYRALRLSNCTKTIGFYGFGSSAHILTQVVKALGGEVFAFTRPGDKEKQAFAKKLGAVWAGGSDEFPPAPLDAAIIFASAGELIPQALQSVRKGATVVCAEIHMSDIPSFPYKYLWGERVLRSVANLTRKDGEDFLDLLKEIKIETEIHVYPLEKANEAIADLRKGSFSGSAVLKI